MHDIVYSVAVRFLVDLNSEKHFFAVHKVFVALIPCRNDKQIIAE